MLIAALLAIGNGGIRTGSSNHAGLLPVVRRILDPQYLPGDFNIEMRLYHHREFAYLVAAFSALFGEDRGLVLLSLISLLMVSGALYYLCRTMKLPAAGFLAAGALVAFSVAWTGYGLEENTFIGNLEIQPPIFTHVLILLSAAMLMQNRYRIPALMAGLCLTLHLQIGAIFTLMLAPFYAVRLKQFGFKEVGRLALIYLIPALPALWHLTQMMKRGVAGPGFSLDYLNFRMPHHFELASTGAGLWVMAHLTAQVVVYLWLSRKHPEESRCAGVLLTLSTMLAVFAVAHFVDYYWLKNLTILKVQFLRVSPLITVFGALAVILALNLWARRSEGRRASVVVYSLLFAAVAAHVAYQTATGQSHYSPAIERYIDRKSAWVDACRWVRANGPRETVYLTPPGIDGFTSLTGRSNVVEFKINPDGAQYLIEWYERLRDLCGGRLPEKRGLKNRVPLNQAFASLSTDQLKALSIKYRAGYAILPQSSGAEFDVLYRNRDFRVVDLSSGTRPASQPGQGGATTR